MRSLDEMVNELSLYIDRLEEEAKKNDDSENFKVRELLVDIEGQLRDVIDITFGDCYTLPRAVEDFGEEKYDEGKNDGYDDGYSDAEWQLPSDQDVDDARSEGYDEGYEKGYDSGQADAESYRPEEEYGPHT